MIKINDQLNIWLGIYNSSGQEGYSDVSSPEDFQYMRIAEIAGGLRPVLNLTFEVDDTKYIPYLNGGNILRLTFAKKDVGDEIYTFEICGDSKNKKFRAGSSISLLCGMCNRDFTSKMKSAEYTSCYAYQALSRMAAADGLNFVTNVTDRTNDKQTWYQNGKTDWEMSKYIAERAYKDQDTFFAYGFDCNNLYFYDVKKLLQGGAKWILTVRGEGSDNVEDPIVNIGAYVCSDTNAGVNANLAGRNLTNVNYNLDTGEFTNPKYSLKSLTTMGTNSVNVNSNGCENYDYSITTNEDHDYAMEAVNQNTRNNILYSSYEVHVPVAGQFRNFKLFDVVQLIPNETDTEAEGIYIITGIVKEYKNLQYTTLLTLNRESANGIKGDLEGGTGE